MKAYLKNCWAPTLALILLLEQESVSQRPLKTQNLDLYYENSYIEYYYFCKQYKDNFDTTGTNVLE